jgi:hypothetical protein
MSSRLSTKQLAKLVGPEKAAQLGLVAAKSKFGVRADKATRTVAGDVYDSASEAKFGCWLATFVPPEFMRRQCKFQLTPKQEIDDPLVGKYSQREMTFSADFLIGPGVDKLPKVILPGHPMPGILVLDFKGFRTDKFIVKKKMFQQLFAIPLVEIPYKYDRAQVFTLIKNYAKPTSEQSP